MKICIVNAHWSNRGDEAALRPIINHINSNFKDIEITVIFKDRKEVKDFPYDANIKHFSAQYLPENLEEILDAIRGKCQIDEIMMKIINTLSRSDLIIYSPGGAVISDKFWWRKQIEYLVPFICAKEYGIPIVVAAPSMGPFDSDDEKNGYRKQWLSYSKIICVRENMSAGYLRKLNLKNVVTTIDTAFWDDPVIEINEKIFKEDKELTEFFGRYCKVIAVTLSDFSWHIEYMNKKEIFKEQKKVVKQFLRLLRDEGYGILLIPQLFGNQNDKEYLKQFMQNNCLILSDIYDTYFQQYMISKCYAVIGMRYHSNIFAAKMSVPFIAIGYEEKMYGFMDDWKLDKYLIKLDELSLDILMDKWAILQHNYDLYKKRLKASREIWRDKAAITINSIDTAIRHTTNYKE